MKKNYKHYHVLGGVRGYLPYTNNVAKTKQEAREILKESIRLDRDNGHTFTGNLRIGYFEELKSKVSLSLGYYYEITEPCYQEECLEDYEE